MLLKYCKKYIILIISRRAGHSNIAITHSIYSHFFDSGFKKVADKMDNFLQVNKLTLAGLLMFVNNRDILKVRTSFFLDYREIDDLQTQYYIKCFRI